MTDSKHVDIEEFNPAGRGFRKVAATVHEFYLSGFIDEPQEYIEWFDTIRNAGAADVVKIYINSPGGAVDTAIQFMRVLSETNATVVCSVEGSCMSAATMIFLCAQEFEITPHSLFMFHNYSGGIFGKGGEIFDQAVFEREWSQRFLKSIYRDFLTEVEIKSLLDNKDIWLHSDEVLTRCTNLANARNKQQTDLELEE
jgi:ATP-dependent Clp protease, protease subunit